MYNNDNRPHTIPESNANQLVKLVIELAISRRTLTTYPAGHPQIDDAFNKVIHSYHLFLQSNPETDIGITKNAIILNGKPLETSQQVVNGFAKILFEHGIAVLTMRPGLTHLELRNFINILGLKREQINQYGGIEAMWGKSGIQSLAIKPLNYSLFAAKDQSSNSNDSSTGIWERITRELLAGNAAAHYDSNTVEMPEELDPEILAEILNANPDTTDGNVINSFVHHSVMVDAARNGSLPCEKIAAFVARLNPGLRQQFIESSQTLVDSRGEPLTEAILSSMPGEALIETFEEFSNNRQLISPVIMSLIARLSGHSDQSVIASKVQENELHSKMRLLLQEHPSEEFVPDDYQQKLNFIIANNQLPQIQTPELEDLLQTIDPVQVEVNISDIIFLLLSEGCESSEERDLLIQNLGEMFEYSLKTGDYQKVLQQLENLNNELLPANIRYYLREYYCQRKFLDEIINGLKTWGKPRYHDIQSMITIIGISFIEPLLDALATEDSLSLRRFIMDRLVEMGSKTHTPIASRLDDNRWFVLRNLIVILKAHEDPAVIPMLRPLSRHPNQKVRQEAIGALISHNDHSAEQQLIHDLDSNDHQTLLSAVHLSEKSSSVEIGKKLLQLLTKLGWTHDEVDIKISVIHSLGEQHLSDSIPELAKILGSSSFFHGKALQQVKMHIIKSLENYNPAFVMPIFERLSTENNQSGIQARKSLLVLKSREKIKNEH